MGIARKKILNKKASNCEIGIYHFSWSNKTSFARFGGRGQTCDDGFFDGVALNLHGFYSGIERTFEDIARTMERSKPKGVDADWRDFQSKPAVEEFCCDLKNRRYL